MAHQQRIMRVEFQPGLFFTSALHLQPLIAVRCVAGHIEASGSALPHPPQHLLAQVVRIELIQAFNDGLEELFSGDIERLGDGDYLHVMLSQKGLENDGVLAAGGQTWKAPIPKWRQTAGFCAGQRRSSV
jgi:hypothetical protein